MVSYDTWLQSASDYERFAGLDGETTEEQDAREIEEEIQFERKMEKEAGI